MAFGDGVFGVGIFGFDVAPEPSANTAMKVLTLTEGNTMINFRKIVRGVDLPTSDVHEFGGMVVSILFDSTTADTGTVSLRPRDSDSFVTLTPQIMGSPYNIGEFMAINIDATTVPLANMVFGIY